MQQTTHSGAALRDTLRAAKLTNTDFARLMGVSRVTVHNWLTGGGAHSLIQTKFAAVLNAVKAAHAAGDLPINIRSAAQRHRAIVAAVRKHLRA